jgi:hypothetical protein
MNVLRCLSEIITLYENGSLLSAESLERGVLTTLERSERPENRIAFGYLAQPCSSVSERLDALRAASSYLSSVYVNRDR